jgi:hypothetical protein
MRLNDNDLTRIQKFRELLGMARLDKLPLGADFFLKYIRVLGSEPLIDPGD